MNKFRVVEKFISINGEGKLAGELAVFIRFAGCNMRCTYCDTLYAMDIDAPISLMSEAEIYEYIKNTGVRNVTLTGGEPLIQPGIPELIRRLTVDENLRIEIETNGSIDTRRFLEGMTAPAAERVSFTIDYKCPASGCESYMYMPNFENVRNSDTVKFVVSDMNDLNRMLEIISEYRLLEKTAVYVSTAFGAIKPEDVVGFMTEHKLNGLRLQLQLHKYIWPPEKRGV